MSTNTNTINYNFSLSSSANLIATSNSNTIGSIITTSGNVGIGTITPNSNLHIASNSTSGELPAILTLQNSHPIFARGQAQIRAVHDATLGPGNALVFFTREDSGSNFDPTSLITEKMRIQNNGNVGIGTTNPSARLQINGDSTALILRTNSVGFNATNPFTGISFKTNVPSDNYTMAQIIARDQSTGITYMSDLIFNVVGQSGSSQLSECMRIRSNGNVGIGVNTPNYLLHLNTDSAGKPNGGSWANSSDQRLKENIELADLNLCYNVIKSLPLKRYRWKDNSYTDNQIKDRNVVGWIAQDVISVFPKAVEEKQFTQVDGSVIEDCLTLNETMINRTLYGAVQKFIEKNESLETELQTTKDELALLKQFLQLKFPDEI